MQLFEELKRRNVFRVALAYLVLGWLVLQVADVLVDALELPAIWSRAVIALLVIGFIPMVVFSWVYELTPDGLKKESEIAPEQSITGHTAKKLNLAIVFLLLVAIGLFAYDRFFASPRAATPEAGALVPQQVARPDEARPSVAVLAFENMSADAENEYFADGISEEILNLLADVSGLSVASRTSAFAFKGKDLPIPEIARSLKVRHVLEGSVRKAGEQVRVTAQLIDAETDRHLWSETFDRALRDVFSIQDEIAAAIGRALQVELLGEGGAEVRSESIDPEVYNRFLEARYLMRRRSDEDLAAGNRLLIDVVAAEPQFARAHVLLGEAYLLSDLLEEDLALRVANMHASLARSLRPELGGIDLILGNIAQERNDHVTALEHYRKAMELEPQEPRPYHWRGHLYSAMGYREECVVDLERALELDPQNPNVHYALAGCLLISGNHDRVVDLATRGSTLGNVGGYSLTIRAELKRGNREKALQHLDHYQEELRVDEESWVIYRSLLEGHREEASLTAEELAIMGPRLWLLLADTEHVLNHMVEGQLDKAATNELWFAGNSALRADPRFIDYMERMGITAVWRAIGPPPGCRAVGDSFSCTAKVTGSE